VDKLLHMDCSLTDAVHGHCAALIHAGSTL